MNLLFADIIDTSVLVYIDDILIFSKNESKHRKHIEAVFQRLAENSFYVKHHKYTLFTPSVEFLGHVVSANGISVCP